MSVIEKIFKTISEATRFQIDEFQADMLIKLEEKGREYEKTERDPEAWRKCHIEQLEDSLINHVIDLKILRDNAQSDEKICKSLIDIANFCFFVYVRRKLDKESVRIKLELEKEDEK